MFNIRKLVGKQKKIVSHFINIFAIVFLLLSPLAITPTHAIPTEQSEIRQSENGNGTPTCVNFNLFTPGESVEGFARVHPDLSITTSTGKAVVIAEDNVPHAYAAPNTPIEQKRGNGNIPASYGIYDEGRLHDYNFVFNLGKTVGSFTINMLDYGDFNQNAGTEHNIRLTAYNINGEVVDTDILSFTSDTGTIPRSGSAGDLWFTGDAVSAKPGEPGNYTFSVEGNAIAFLELRASSNVDPIDPSDPYFALTNLCFELEQDPLVPPNTSCQDFNVIPSGQSVEGMGTIFPDFNITTTSGKAVSIQENGLPHAYAAPNEPVEIKRGNGGMSNSNGFYDADRKHNYDFAFDLGTTADYFAVTVLDYGDFNQNAGTQHDVRLTAYNINGDVVDADILTFTSDAGVIPHSGSAGDLWFTGDAVSAKPGEPGNYTFIVTGENISYLELRASSNVDPNGPSDPYFGLTNLCFNIEEDVVISPPTSICADFNNIVPGNSVEGLGTLHPNLNITTSTGNAIAITDNEIPHAYAAPNEPASLKRGNGGIIASGGFFDAGRIHDYDFAFDLGTTADYFAVTVLDYGDFNQNAGTQHDVRLTAYNINGDVVDADILTFTSDAGVIPHSGSAGDLWFTGDAVSAKPGQPGNYTFIVTGENISYLELRASSNVDPNGASDPYFGLANLCFDVEEDVIISPPTSVCADFNNIVPGNSVEGLGTLHPNLNITASSGNAIAIADDSIPHAYAAPNEPASLKRGNGGVIASGGFFDADRIHEYNFAFAPGQVATEFSINMLDYGDFNEFNAIEHEVKLIAYDKDDNIVAADTLSFTSDAGTIPHSGSAGDLWFTGDAVSSKPGEPGNYTFHVEGKDITRVEFRGSNNVNPNARSDPYFALNVLCFTLEPLPPSDSQQACEDFDLITLAENNWDEHVIRDMTPVELEYERPYGADFAIVNTAWRWGGHPNQYQVTEKHSVETPVGTAVSDDYGDEELDGETIWYDSLADDYSDDNFTVTIDYAGDGSDPGSHFTYGQVLWCAAELPTLPPTTYETCEDHNMVSVGSDSWEQHIWYKSDPKVFNFSIPQDASFGIVNTGWEWTGRADQAQLTEKHTVATPLGTTTSDDYGNEELINTILWYDQLSGNTSGTDFEVVLSYAGDGSDAGSHLSHGFIDWCRAP